MLAEYSCATPGGCQSLTLEAHMLWSHGRISLYLLSNLPPLAQTLCSLTVLGLTCRIGTSFIIPLQSWGCPILRELPLPSFETKLTEYGHQVHRAGLYNLGGEVWSVPTKYRYRWLHVRWSDKVSSSDRSCSPVCTTRAVQVFLWCVQLELSMAW